MSGITTHVLDTARGRPAAGVPVTLEHRPDGGGWEVVASGRTGLDGRLTDLCDDAHPGHYRLRFDVDAYLAAEAFFPEVTIHFVVADDRHHHIPLLLSPFGYSTYRGS